MHYLVLVAARFVLGLAAVRNMFSIRKLNALCIAFATINVYFAISELNLVPFTRTPYAIYSMPFVLYPVYRSNVDLYSVIGREIEVCVLNDGCISKN